MIKEKIINQTKKISVLFIISFIVTMMTIVSILGLREMGNGNIFMGLNNLNMNIYISTFKNTFKNNLESIIKVSFGLTSMGYLMILTSNNHSEKTLRSEMGVVDQDNNRMSDDVQGSSRFLTKEETNKKINNFIYPKETPKKGLVLGMEKEKSLIGKKRERIYQNTGDEHGLLLAVTGEGKDRTIMLQSIWATAYSGESLIVIDPKGDMLATSFKHLKKHEYDIDVIDLQDFDYSNRWDMMKHVNKAIDNSKYQMADMYAKTIAQLLCYEAKTSTGSPIWYNSSVSSIQSLILYVSIECEDDNKRHMGSVITMFRELAPQSEDDEESELDQLMSSLSSNHLAKRAYSTKSMSSGATATSINASTSSNIQVLNSEAVEKIISKNEIDFSEYADGHKALFIKLPSETQAYNSLATILIEQSYQALITKAKTTGNRLKNKVYYYVNETGNLPKIPELANKVTLARSYGISFYFALQDYQQFEKIYKKDSKTIRSNCKIKVYIKTDDPKTNKEFSNQLGEYTRYQSTPSINYNQHGKSTLSVSAKSTNRQVMKPEELAKIPYGEAVILYKSEPIYMNTPDLSEYRANIELGLAPKSGNVEKDQEENRKILQKRMMELKDMFLNEPYKIEYFNPYKKNNEEKKEVKSITEEMKDKDKKIKDGIEDEINKHFNDDIKDDKETDNKEKDDKESKNIKEKPKEEPKEKVKGEIRDKVNYIFGKERRKDKREKNNDDKENNDEEDSDDEEEKNDEESDNVETVNVEETNFEDF